MAINVGWFMCVNVSSEWRKAFFFAAVHTH